MNSTWYPEIEEPIKSREKHYSLVLYILSVDLLVINSYHRGHPSHPFLNFLGFAHFCAFLVVELVAWKEASAPYCYSTSTAHGNGAVLRETASTQRHQKPWVGWWPGPFACSQVVGCSPCGTEPTDRLVEVDRLIEITFNLACNTWNIELECELDRVMHSFFPTTA